MESSRRSQIGSGLLALSMMIGVGSASAVPSYCAAAPQPLDQSNSDGLSRDGASFRSAVADACYGVGSGNDSLSLTNSFLLFGGGWTVSMTDGGEPATLPGYLGLDWTLSAPQNLRSGNWTLTIADPGVSSLPLTVDMMVVLKGGRSWAAYMFDDQSFLGVGSSTGSFDIGFHNNGGQVPGLGDMTLYLRPGQASPSCPSGLACTVEQRLLPEPGALALLGLGLATLGLARRRRQH